MNLQSTLDQYDIGVRIVTVKFQDVTPPDPVKAAYNEVNESEQQRESLIFQAREQYNREVPRARGEAKKVLQEAEGYAVERVNKARGETNRFLALLTEYRKAPSVTRSRIYLETLEEVLPRLDEIYVMDDKSGGLLPLLPLRKSSGRRGQIMKAPIIFVLIIVAVIFVGMDGLYVVNEAEQAILTQFGKPVGGVADPGLHFKIPFVQKVSRFEKRILKWDGDPNQIPTKDKRFIWIDTTARWRIKDPLLFYTTVATERGATEPPRRYHRFGGARCRLRSPAGGTGPWQRLQGPGGWRRRALRGRRGGRRQGDPGWPRRDHGGNSRQGPGQYP